MLPSCKSNKIDKAEISEMDSLSIVHQCQYFDSLGYSSYDDPETMISYFDSSAQIAKLINSKSNGTRFLNIASIFVESMSQYDKALPYLDSATIIYRATYDTVRLANILKYRGFVSAKTGEIDSGLADISYAIDLFTLKDYKPGVAVSLFDLALINEIQGDHNEAVKNLNKAKSYWISIANNSRIFGINNKLMINYRFLEKETMIDSLINENKAIKAKIELSEIELNEFEKILKEYSAVN